MNSRSACPESFGVFGSVDGLVVVCDKFGTSLSVVYRRRPLVSQASRVRSVGSDSWLVHLVSLGHVMSSPRSPLFSPVFRRLVNVHSVRVVLVVVECWSG